MKKIKQLLLISCSLLWMGVNAQKVMPAGETGMLPTATVTPSIAQQIKNETIKYADNAQKPTRAKGHSGAIIVPGKGSTGNDPLLEIQQNQRKQESQMRQSRAPITTFVGDESQRTPSDPTGAAGPNHYIGAWNTAFRIFDKQGNPLTDELSLATLFGETIGDPIVFYDANVDNGPGNPRGRFIITQFDENPNSFNVAVSAGPDPVNDEWYIYTTGFGTGQFPDYTKFAVWGDSYIITANIQQENRVFAIERNQMLQDLPAQFAAFPLPGISGTLPFFSPHGFHTTGDETVPIGTPAPIVFMQDDAFEGVDDDHLKIWEATIDWDNPANHSIELAQEIITEDFVSVFDGGEFSNIPQITGQPDVDVLQNTMSNQVQYRRFPTHNSVIMNFVVDVLDPGEKAGIRWYELRQDTDGDDWTIYQEGTYVVDGERSVFQGSMVMDSNGNIALGYVSSSANDPIGMHYTGRFDGDPLGVMTVFEQDIFISTAGNPADRFADYTHMTLDPVDDSFWFIAEQFDPSRRDIVSNFVLDGPFPNDIGILAFIEPTENNGVFTDDEEITITITNFGTNSIIDPSVQYSINGESPVVESFLGTIEPRSSVDFTFAQRADLSIEDITYTITASAFLENDGNINNDSITITVTNTGQVCIPETTASCISHGIKMFALVDIFVDNGGNGCNSESTSGELGYADRTNLITDLSRISGANVRDMRIQQNVNQSVGVSAVSAWIDFNDNGIFESSEQLVDTEFFTVFDELQDFELTIPEDAVLGPHILRVRSIDTSGAGDINDPCGDFQFGETHDYTVNIVDVVLNVDDSALLESDFSITTTDNNLFSINIVTTFEGRGAITIYNLSGQRLAHNNLRKEGNAFNYELDMSYVASGIYIVQFSDIDGNSKLVEKIIVE